MFLQERSTRCLIEVLDTQVLFDPMRSQIDGRKHAGEELQDPEQFEKSSLLFPSGEALPLCWIDSAYRAHQLAHS
jgi:hypothetical protein